VIAVVTDSAANIPRDVAAGLGIDVVPMYLRLDGGSFRDGVDPVGSDVSARLASATTAAPSPGDFRDAFERAEADAVVCVTVAGGVSFTNQAATMAAAQCSKRVIVVDSGSATMGQGFVAMEAARAARDGAGLDAVVARAREVAERVRIYAAIDTFEYLRRSGRVTKLHAYAATRLDIKPVFRFRAGEPGPVARPRTRARALARVVDESVAEMAGRPVHVAGLHVEAPVEAGAMMELVAGRANVVEGFLIECTPVVGAHTGPGLVGLAFFCD
jgi:fatty acid kinase fatty acid binding subunit